MSKREERIVLSIQTADITRTKIEAEKRAKILNECLAIIKEMTDDEVTSLELDAVANWLNTKTGFFNPEFSADALGVKNEYLFLKQNLTTPDSEFIVKKKGLYTVNEQEIIERFTSYLNDEYIEQYKQLKSVAESLKTVDRGLLKALVYGMDNITINNTIFNTMMQFKKHKI